MNISAIELAQAVGSEAQLSTTERRWWAFGRRFLTNKSGAVSVVVLAGIGALIPLMIWGVPSGGDLTNHYRFAQPFYDSITSGHVAPGWLAESNYGFGDARFRFYPPGLYYLLAALKSATGWYWASALAFTLLSVLGGLGTYFWVRASHAVKVAMWAGVIYTIAPYHLNELYQASLLSEYAACSVLPFLFAFVERVCRRRRTADIAGLAASYALLVLTHLPLTVIGSLSLGVYALFLLRRDRRWVSLMNLALGVIVGLAASSFFWTTMLAELPWIKGNSANQNLYYNYRANFLFSPSALTNRNTWYANLLALALLASVLPAFILIKKKARGSSTRAVAALTVISFLMATEISRPLWLVIPKLSEVQFPWRWLSIASLGGSVLLAVSLPKWKELLRKGVRPLHLIPALGIILSLVFVATQVIWDSEYLPRHEFDSLLKDIRGSASFKDWMPIWAGDGIEAYGPSALVAAGARKISVAEWQPEHRQFTIEPGPSGEARVRTFYYPLWTASADGQPLSTRPAPDGALMIAIPAEVTTISLDFREPPRIQIVRFVSLAGWLVILALSVHGLRKVRGPDLIGHNDR
jgi:uncharacterized membrane protein (UPF0136 family)